MHVRPKKETIIEDGWYQAQIGQVEERETLQAGLRSKDAFDERGLDALTPGSSRPKRVHAAFDEKSAEALREMLHRSPREFGYDTRACGPWRWRRRRAL